MSASNLILGKKSSKCHKKTDIHRYIPVPLAFLEKKTKCLSAGIKIGLYFAEGQKSSVCLESTPENMHPFRNCMQDKSGYKL